MSDNDFEANFNDAADEAQMVSELNGPPAVMHPRIEANIASLAESLPAFVAGHLAHGDDLRLAVDSGTMDALRIAAQWGFSVGRAFQAHDYPLPANVV
jgi:5,10-methenyltetrahydromethanopterin hydrogenase